MRVLMLSKALVVGIYQRKLAEMARLGVELLAVVPPSWKDERGETSLERVDDKSYRLEVLPLVNNGDFHLHFYHGLGRVMRDFRPQIVHIDEEPYNLAAWQALYHAQRVGAKSVFFSWQNIFRRYPPPFGWGEAWLLHAVDHAIVGTDGSAAVWRAKGYRGALSVIPQFGTDEMLFAPAGKTPLRPFTIGYFGRLVEEKGVHVLLDAVTQLGGDWRLLILGSGPERDALAAQAGGLGISNCVQFLPPVPSLAIAPMYHQIDVLALPSLTRSHWKEQFGRVLVEAMMSGVPVVGSNSAAIPDVIGGTGVITPEGDAAALANALRRLRDDVALRTQLALDGRARALARFTHAQVADATVAVYRHMLGEE